MKNIIFLFFIMFFFFPNPRVVSTNIELRNKILKIQEMPTMPRLSGDSLFWSIIEKRLMVIPDLLLLLNDTVQTKAGVIYFGGTYSVGDVSCTAIHEIIRDIPIQNFLKVNYTSYDSSMGYWNYWNYVRKSYKNRVKLKLWLTNWYKRNKNNLIWVEDNNLYRKKETRNPKYYKHPAGGYFIIHEE